MTPKRAKQEIHRQFTEAERAHLSVLLDALLEGGGEVSVAARSLAHALQLPLTGVVPLDLSLNRQQQLKLNMYGHTYVAHLKEVQVDANYYPPPGYGYQPQREALTVRLVLSATRTDLDGNGISPHPHFNIIDDG